MEDINKIDTTALKAWVTEFARVVATNEDMLNELDAATGDADHGSNLSRGMRAVVNTLNDPDSNQRPADFLKKVGTTVVNKVGGSSGALFGTIFLRLATSIRGMDQIDDRAFARGWRVALEGVAHRGKVKTGDKTLYDALSPAVDALEHGLREGNGLPEALRAATAAAELGRDSTISMSARRGKSMYAGDKSIGHQDPGATSATMLIAAAAALEIR